MGGVAVPSWDPEDGARAELEMCCSAVTQPKNNQFHSLLAAASHIKLG